MKKGTLESIPEEYGEDLNEAIFWMLAVDPKKRPNTAELLQMDFIQDALVDLSSENLLILPPAPQRTFNHFYAKGKYIG